MKTAIVAVLTVCMLAGCSSSETTVEQPEQKTEQRTETKTEVQTEDSTDAIITDKIPRITKVGSDVNGYIDLTQGEWVEFKETGGFNDKTVVASDQATTVTNSAIITMITYDIDMNLDDMAKNAMAYCESNGAKDVEGSRVTIGEYDCDQVYCYYPDYGRYLVTWYFKADDGYVHYIAAEFSADDTYVADLIKSYHIDNTDSLQGKEDDAM